MKKFLLLFFILFSIQSLKAQTIHNVVFTWTPSTTIGVSYNLYRGTVTGGVNYTLINFNPMATNCSGATCTYTDTNVVQNTKYYYYMKAVLNGVFSISTPELSVTIPSDISMINPPTGVNLVVR